VSGALARPGARVVIAGASLAGLAAARTLRAEGFDGELVLVGAEPHLPYDRTMLSKELLLGEVQEPRPLADAAELAALDAEWLLGRRARALRADVREVELDDGRRLRFDALAIATGATPRRLPLAALDGVSTFRDLDDARALRRALVPGARVVVIGGGFVGLEVAAAARHAGAEATIVEAAGQPLAPVLGTTVGAIFARLHREEGVAVHTGVQVRALEGRDRIERVVLEDGRVLAAEAVVVGIGAQPATSWLLGSGLTLDGGVVCDERLATAIPGVVAAGDVARWRHVGLDALVRSEHWETAHEQGAVAAQRLLHGAGGAAPFAPLPFVSSRQYDQVLHVAGWPAPAAELVVLDGDPAESRLTAAYVAGGQVRAVLALNDPRGFRRLRRALGDGAPLAALAGATA
jgi:3-phenylpropionate/trans-cinnamate dioxygenase ferredoxin reductase component